MNEKVEMWIQAVSKFAVWGERGLTDEEYKLLEDVAQYGVSELATVVETKSIDNDKLKELKEIILKGAGVIIND